MEPITVFSSRTVLLPRADIDTDQIIPARFLTTTSREGLGNALFADWRYDSDGESNAEFVLNQPESAGAEVLVAGRNFGCGSSREHAPWALADYGFRAVISTEIADIFRSNSLKNGLLPIVVSAAFHEQLLSVPCGVEVNLETRTVRVTDGPHAEASEAFEIDDFSRYCLMRGTDQLGFLLDRVPAISAFETQRSDPTPQ
ncbi:MAG: 3-isopropylmalate dehydratase small subunit [Pseudomonadota bacterium]